MLRIPCPWCGVRDEVEFRYKGDASVQRPGGGGGGGSGGAGGAVAAAAAVVDPAVIDAFAAYVYERGNPRGWHVEWWLHAAGCRQLLKIRRHTLTHVIHAVAGADQELPPPPEGV